VQYAVVAGEAVWQLVVDNVRWHPIKVVAALKDIPGERPVLICWDQRPLLFVQALARWQRPVDAVRPFAAVPAASARTEWSYTASLLLVPLLLFQLPALSIAGAAVLLLMLRSLSPGQNLADFLIVLCCCV
jgi:hypothetical protein